MNYRHTRDLLGELGGRAARRLRSLISRRQLALDESDGERVTALGREALDGSVEEDEMDSFGPVGLVGRPAGDATVEAAVAFVGADGAHPIALSYVDGTRRAVIDAVGLGADETVVYNSQAVVKLLADGTVEIRSLEGSAQALAFLDSVNQRFDAVESQLQTIAAQLNGHGHLGNLGAPTSPPIPAGPAVEPPEPPPGEDPPDATPVVFTYNATSAAAGTDVLKSE
ncbi:hypothetical protein [Haliangium sp.]|uniref:hypothetical protein n=1 Tax=Haliangium sp. TaxID=2663208 RepID=UPI003D0CCBC1